MMKTAEIKFNYHLFDDGALLAPEDFSLLQNAREMTQKAYAPYSSFLVGATALLVNGSTVSGTNQENASYPVGICAERVLLSSAAILYTDIPIQTMAIACHNLNGQSQQPVSPCGMCRQSLLEYEERMKHPIRLILSGMTGKVIVIDKAGQLLPLSFGSIDLH
jgi:cytidine deaminase